jgi:hypothetical protein
MNRIKLNTSNESTVLMRNSNGNQTGTPSKRRGGNEARDPHPLLNKNLDLDMLGILNEVDKIAGKKPEQVER